MLILIKKILIKSLLYSRYYAVACNECRGSDSRAAKASASGAVDFVLIPSLVKPMPL